MIESLKLTSGLMEPSDLRIMHVPNYILKNLQRVEILT